ncbi:hypothetical protein [Streptomyces sp. IMTB 2501]|uniref:hypothetical protein n=1 Tax=Streptomyces sp. IMTB 2501 TaxID=1776340 RepID=UPI001C4D69EB|nr:hypothetical protein [Streptomyces sp. IMTB 2501]
MAAAMLSHSELVCLALVQALLGYHSEARWLRFARKRLVGLFPYLLQQSVYNKRLRAALPLVKRTIRQLAMDSDFWTDTVWITDSTPVPCGMSPDSPALQAGGLGRLGLLQLPLPVLLGPAPVPGLHADQHADHVGARQPEDR